MSYTIKPLACLFVTFLCLCFFSCRPEPPILEQVSISEPVFQCGVYQNTETFNGFQAFAKARVSSFGSFIAIASEDSLELRSEITAAPIWKEELGVKKMLPWQGQLLISSDDGIYLLDQALNFRQLLPNAVTDIAIGPQDEILFIDQANPPYRVFELSQPDNQVLNYTEPYNTSLCAAPEQLLVAGNGEIWIINCNKDFIQYLTLDQAYVYEGQYSLFLGYEDIVSLTANSTENGLVVLIKSSGQYFSLFQKEAANWNLIWESNVRAEDPLQTQIRLATPNDILVIDRTIYLSTNAGVIRFMQNEVGGTAVDFDIVHDPNWGENAVFQIYQRENDLYYISNNNNVFEIDCN